MHADIFKRKIHYYLNLIFFSCTNGTNFVLAKSHASPYSRPKDFTILKNKYFLDKKIVLLSNLRFYINIIYVLSLCMYHCFF